MGSEMCIRDSDVKRSRLIVDQKMTIKKVGKGDFVGFQPGDQVSILDDKLFSGPQALEPGETIEISVLRDGQNIKVPYTVRTVEGSKSHFIREANDMTTAEATLQLLWFSN